jgi:hypothetical protein
MGAARLLTILVPAYNERQEIAGVLTRAARQPLDADLAREIVVIDDASTDATGEEVRRWIDGPDRPPGVEARLLRHERNRGKGAALRTGIADARGDVVLFQDADGELDPAEYPGLLAPITAGEADVVFGSRFLRPGPVPFVARQANRCLTFLTNLATGACLTDMETGFKVFRADVLKALPLREERFGIEVELAVRTVLSGARIREVPVGYRPRTRAEGKKIGWRDGIAAVAKILRYGLGPAPRPRALGRALVAAAFALVALWALLPADALLDRAARDHPLVAESRERFAESLTLARHSLLVIAVAFGALAVAARARGNLALVRPPPTPAPAPLARRWYAAAFVAALAARLPMLDAPLGVDEQAALFHWVSRPIGTIVFELKYVGNHLLQNVLSWVTYRIGEGPVWLRLPNLLAGAASAPLLLAVTRRFLPLRWSVFATALLVVGGFHVRFSQSMRSYSLVVFLVLWIVWLAQRAAEGGRRLFVPALAAGFLLCTANFSQPMTALGIVAALFAWTCLGSAPNRFRVWWTLAVPFSIGALCYLPHLAFALPWIRAYNEWALASWRTFYPADAAFGFTLWRTCAVGTPSWAPTALTAAAWAALPLAALGLWRIRRGGIGVALLVGPAALFHAGWLAADYPGFARIFLMDAALAAIALAAGVATLERRTAYVVAALLLIASACGTVWSAGALDDLNAFGDAVARHPESLWAAWPASVPELPLTLGRPSVICRWEVAPPNLRDPFIACVPRWQERAFVQKYGPRVSRLPMESRGFVAYRFAP